MIDTVRPTPPDLLERGRLAIIPGCNALGAVLADCRSDQEVLFAITGAMTYLHGYACGALGPAAVSGITAALDEVSRGR